MNDNDTNENKKRQGKSISFDLTDEYEKGLLEHAERSDKGKFSRYIKRLIAEDRARSSNSSQGKSLPEALDMNDSNDASVVVEGVDIVAVENKNSENANNDTNAMKDFL